MGIEIRPLGSACNPACHCGDQNSQREGGNQRTAYNLDRMKAEALRIGGPITLVGGEPLLMRFEDLENLFSWSFEKLIGSALQTNGILIENRHIDLFRRYQVSVFISIDGPGELNHARWHRGLEKTRASTAAVENVIRRLSLEYEAPSLIITLHRDNATAEQLPRMIAWVRHLHGIGIRDVRLQLLELNHASLGQQQALSPRENVTALLAFADLQSALPGLHFDLFDEMEALLEGSDKKVACTWRACDPYTTDAIQTIAGNGQSSNCGRLHKDGIGFIQAQTVGYERYQGLYRTSQAENGCKGCRFFLMCKGQCPATAVDGDWRNRTEHCEEWKQLFGVIERRMMLAGKVPLTIQPHRTDLERMQMQAWERGENPLLSRLLALWHRAQAKPARAAPIDPLPTAKPAVRIGWVSEFSREIWEQRFHDFSRMFEDMTIHAATMAFEQCAVRLIPMSRYPRLKRLASNWGLSTATLPAGALPGGICTRRGDGEPVVLLVGTVAIVENARVAWEGGDLSTFRALLALPQCCLRQADAPAEGPMSNDLSVAQVSPATACHSLLAPLGISVLPIGHCSVACAAALAQEERWLELAAARSFYTESRWLRDCFSWPISCSELHGVVEIKTPLFHFCFPTPRATQSPGQWQMCGAPVNNSPAQRPLAVPLGPQ